ncbi:MAG: 2-amino-4-hydroxy-6-hydroxymethyldihydropteridine diphosphokinase [Bacteroidetes bacterium]|nr:2-amino-4-hydroxy-6-hydroxymethyldihydropteridine diphosphokinase [Bacteroidota bacterium]
MNEVFLCLGGNLGDRLQNLNTAKALIAEGCGKITAQSKIYETQAWGSTSKNGFLNQVIKITTKSKANILLYQLLMIEKRLGRTRTKNKNGDRTIDIDILFYNQEVINTDGIEIPHPRLHLRKFVLKPMADIAPGFEHPLYNKTIKMLLQECADVLKVKPVPQVHYICVEGNIGSGKTTLAKALAVKLGSGFLPEQFEKNDLLPLFYANPELYAFPLEYSFLLNRFQHIMDAFRNGKNLVVSDYSIYKCLWFARVNLSKKDFLFFEKHFHAIESQLPKPDLIVYLDTSTNNLKKNIRARGRAYEQNIKSGYLDEIGKQCKKGISKLDGIETLVIPIRNYNLELNSALIKTIKNHIL